ncbi:MAG: deoxyribose-phosphate aldolase [Clostridiales bacterium]|nr:deoxyribose-phosphate aldolase [Clostridiales bacterium]
MSKETTICGLILEKPLSKYIDHTLLKPEAEKRQVEKLCLEAIEYNFASVCVNSCHASLVSKMLSGSDVLTCCVVGFPLGAMATEAKAFETRAAVTSGAQEIDMVINIGALKDGDTELVFNDIAAVVKAAEDKAIVKVIIETCLLSDEEKVKACELSQKAGAHFVKTSTGFSKDGASVHDVALMRKTVGNDMKVKASGGIRNLKSALSMIEAGANRIGASAGVQIIKEAKEAEG